MKTLREKRISVKILLFSVVGMLIAYIGKVPMRDCKAFVFKKQLEFPLNYYCVDVFGLEISYSLILILLVILLGLGAYLFLYTTDAEILVWVNKVVKKMNKYFKKMRKYFSNHSEV